MGWLCPVGKGIVAIGPGLPVVGGAAYDWEDACDAAAMWGCRLVVSVGQTLPSGDGLARNGLPAFAQACLERRMDWSHCPTTAGPLDGLVHPLAFSWAMPLRLGARIWVESSTTTAAWPVACAFLQAAGLEREGVALLQGSGVLDTESLLRVWDGVGCWQHRL